jgi:hypothetical protein
LKAFQARGWATLTLFLGSCCLQAAAEGDGGATGDAGVDGGASTDAGSLDAGLSDAGLTDAGEGDAGSMADAGPCGDVSLVAIGPWSADGGLNVLITITVDQPFRIQLVAQGGCPPYEWSLVVGGGLLPYGIELLSSGVMTGTPTQPGVYSFSLNVADQAGTTATTQRMGIEVMR